MWLTSTALQPLPEKGRGMSVMAITNANITNCKYSTTCGLIKWVTKHAKYGDKREM